MNNSNLFNCAVDEAGKNMPVMLETEADFREFHGMNTDKNFFTFH